MVKDLAQALLSCNWAASHTDPHLCDIAWSRENAILALRTAVSLAQIILARTQPETGRPMSAVTLLLVPVLLLSCRTFAGIM
jgi:hypothetical protein